MGDSFQRVKAVEDAVAMFEQALVRQQYGFLLDSCWILVHVHVCHLRILQTTVEYERLAVGLELWNEMR